MRTTRSLSFFVAVWMAAAIGLSMAAYAVYEYATMPGATVKELALQHLGHVLALGILTYTLCWAVFYFVLLRPLSRIYLHLYTVGAGKLKTLELDSNVREIRTIVDGVNLMLSRLKLGADGDALELAEKRIAEIRELASHLPTAQQEQLIGLAEALRDKLTDLEKSLPRILAAQGSLSSPADAESSGASGGAEGNQASAGGGGTSNASPPSQRT